MADPSLLPSATPRWGDARTRSVWMWQLIFSASAVAVIATYVMLQPELFAKPHFVTGVLGIVALAGVALMTPWHRIPGWGVAMLPMADVVIVGLMSGSGETRATLLWIFPIAWLATYYRLPWLIAALSAMGLVLLAEAIGNGIDPALIQRALIILLSLAFMGVTINVGARRTRAYRLLLRRQFSQLDRTRRRAESQAARVAMLADTLDTGIGLIDRDGVLFDGNRAFLDLYGADSIAEFTPTGAVEYNAYRGTPLPPDQTLIGLAAAGETFVDRRIWLYSPHGQWRALDATTRPVLDPAGEPTSNLLVVRDVTEAVEAERDRKNVSSVVSHELRNPLTAVLGHTDLLLEREDLPADVLNQLSIIDNAGQRMQRLITSALAGFRSENATDEQIDLRALVEASIAAFSPTAAAAQVMLTMKLERDCVVVGDAFGLRQAIDNIIGNAVKYTTRGGSVHVTLGAAAGSDDETDGSGADEVALAVADTGIGMSDDDRARMSERGFRSAVARASGIPGSGIGFSLTADIIARHRGRLDVASALGRGTTVTIVLPRATSPRETTNEGMPV